MPALTDSERMIADSANGFVKQVGGIERVRRCRDAGQVLDRDTWRAMAGMGWLGAMASDDRGGLDLTARDVLVLLESAGRSALFEPLASAISAGHCLSRNAPQHPQLRRLIAGESVVVPMLAPALSLEGSMWIGATAWGVDAGCADAFLLGAGSEATSRLALVPRDARGVTVESRATVDGGSTGFLRFNGAAADRFEVLAEGSKAQAAIAAMIDLQRLGHAAELVGVAASAFDITVDYLKTRTQFGVPIGSFQALQHRAATAFVRIAASRALVYEAVSAFAAPRQTFAAAGALLCASEMAIAVTKECVQMHGAIGFTDEYQVGLFLKRSMALCATAGADRLLQDAARHMREGAA